VARGNDGRVYVNTTETVADLTCPTGYIKVPGNSLYQTKDFCVMKYEAKTGSGTVAATTQAAGLPRVNINQTDAITSCSLNGAGYALISNAEWMTIARNIEAQSSNWRNGIIGSTDASGGGLWRGHGDNNPPNSLSANIDDNLGYEGTGNSSPSNQKRTHTLSNGEVIWDLGGNVWELTNDIVLGKDQPTGGSTGFNWRQYNTGQSDSITNFGTLSRDLVGPSNSNLGITHNMGRIYSDGTVTNNDIYALRRGGNWGSNTDTSIFTVALNTSQSDIENVTGFRCVVR
jgi:formylglycine-generating enzyme required for sulfatase activity